MTHKLFPKDKNYILKQAQDLTRGKLLQWQVDQVKQAYICQFNPLGLNDHTSCVIANAEEYPTDPLNELYYELAGIYRFKYGSDQLEFIFDGRDHLEVYQEEWAQKFKEWNATFFQSKPYIRAVLEATIFNTPERQVHLACNRLKAFTSHYFHVKVHKRKGIVPMKVA